jgi:UDP-glucose 4-epimerase
VLPRFIHQALAGEPLTVYGDGTMIRAFTHVRDLAEGILRVMERGKSGRVYNLGNPANKTTILDLAREVIRLTGSSSRIAFIDPTTLWGPLYAEANDKYPDARRAIEELGWRPRFSLADAIRDTATYIQAGRCD